MKTVNLRYQYPDYYSADELINLDDDVAEELIAEHKYIKSHIQRMHRSKTFLIDPADMWGVEFSYTHDDPAVIIEMADEHCRLCQALSSLPDVQRRRIEAHYLHKKSQKSIAADEKVTKGSVSLSISRGLAAMRKIMEDPHNGANRFCQCG